MTAPFTLRAAFAKACYHAGAKIVGGGHVILPLLDAATAARGAGDTRSALDLHEPSSRDR